MKKITGVTLVTATTLIALNPSPSKQEELTPRVNLQQDLHSTSLTDESLQIPVTLVDTIDGDTIKVRVQRKIETVRYLLMDTPESKKPKMCVQPYAKEAFFRNEELVMSGSLTIEYEKGNIRDSYGRLLAYVYVDGQSVQETLLREGFARVAYIMNPPYKYLSLYREDERLAQRGQLNIWSKPNFVREWGFNGCAPS
ncbi:thermonuclease family protein [Neobacillus cucumis]|uniref:Endonuclease n=1 Tax=Neobacillus cucumis TaxID=1740721 RepID=A0A2N5HAE8_9BACI|nr:thermonuclease family protein [Neobacillus cucumis]PLS02485.1 endonuclease [Neobacillus cucumis]